ncbi:nucleoporin-domain-containing protein [Polyplosphaeria fusca]|uniref:Nucleoporin-domain-containing protein n=1 Tax=Polyplosphaeria fusca TaxID=682080 RepID=A0A9P4QY95_9PLEO|nr:nucleoporin-domain-containing protein [Polyplosphaeria fusca]
MMPATPQRPTPGAFIATPAPGRPGLFRGSSMQQPQPPPSLSAPAPSLTPIERAARTINDMLAKDKRYPELESYISTQGASGDYDRSMSPAWTPFQKLRTYEVPERIFEQVNMTQMSTNMGLFAEINHAWVTIDNQLYLWDYTHPNPELVGYEEQPNTIISVKLVKPRAGCFLNTISHLLVVATIADIFLIGVELHRGAEGVHGLTLYQTKLSVSVKGLIVSCIEGSAKTGRIFFADGRNREDIYELHYQLEESWFQSKCSKTNHVSQSMTLPTLSLFATQKTASVAQMAIDDTRNLLYCLSSNGTIRVFHMPNLTALKCVITKPLAQIRTNCSHFVRQSELLGPNSQIVSISPITAPESDQVSLMATTSTGVRIFFSATSGGYYTDPTAAPNNMQVRHVRFPPSDGQAQAPSPSNQVQRYAPMMPEGTNSQSLMTTTRAHRYAPGSFFCFVRKQPEGNESLFMSAPHSGIISSRGVTQGPRYLETSQLLNLAGTVQDVGSVTEPFSAAGKPLGFGNELAVQFDQPVSEYAILTHNGIETVRRRRLVDILASILKYGGGEEGDVDVKKILLDYGRSETAATALAVACCQGSDIGPDSRISKVTDPEIVEAARRIFIEQGGKPTLNENSSVDGISVENVLASPRHDGIAIYVARLVRSIWDSPITKTVKTATGLSLQPAHQVPKLQDIQKALVQLQEFLEQNKHRIEGLGGPEALGRVTSRQAEVELQGENRALTSLLQLINNAIEGIAFVLVLFEERLDDIVVLLPADAQGKIQKLSYQGLFSTKEGKDLAKELVKAIVNRSIMKGSNVETVAEALRRKCGSFCSSDDVVIFKAQENLKKAIDVGANAERGRLLLNDSLRLFEQVAKSLTMENLTAAVDRYIELEFYAGAIRLVLKVASELDRGNKALSWIKDGKPGNDIRQEAFEQRRACYNLIFKVIEAVDLASNNQGYVPEGVVSQISRRKYEAYEQINNSEDEVFQNDLYDWYLQKNWADRLLEINSPFVVDYLRRKSEDDIAHADLLWRYYAHYKDWMSAAEVQFQLAKSPFEIPLGNRIEYLSRARGYASTRSTGFAEVGRNRQSRQELLRSISDHLDIANIQDDILQRIKVDSRLVGERREGVLKTLDGQIQPLDDLYHTYADQAAYYDICLYIYHAADYRNLPNVRNTWTNEIEATHERAAAEKQAAPWELVAYETEKIGRRVNLNENVFPVNIILQLLLQYDIQYYKHEPQQTSGRGLFGPGASSHADDEGKTVCNNLTWPIDVFVSLNAPFETVVATLESIWYAQEHPFGGRNRKLLVKWMIYAVEQWFEASRKSGRAFGSEENALGVADLLRVVGAGDELSREYDPHWSERARVLGEQVNAVVR